MLIFYLHRIFWFVPFFMHHPLMETFCFYFYLNLISIWMLKFGWNSRLNHQLFKGYDSFWKTLYWNKQHLSIQVQSWKSSFQSSSETEGSGFFETFCFSHHNVAKLWCPNLISQSISCLEFFIHETEAPQLYQTWPNSTSVHVLESKIF